MAIKRLKKLNTANRDLNLIQDNTEDAINSIALNSFLNGNILEDIQLVTGQDNIVNHKLGKKLQGWLLVGNNANSVIYDNQSSNNTPNLTLLLRATANCTVKLYVF